MTWTEMQELSESVASPWALLLTVAVFGFAPVFTVRVAVLLYPVGHPRRKELVAELYKLRRITRVFFAAEVVANAMVEGFGERRRARKLVSDELQEHRRLRRMARYMATYSAIMAALSMVILGFDAANSKLSFGEVVIALLWTTCFFVVARRSGRHEHQSDDSPRPPDETIAP